MRQQENRSRIFGVLSGIFILLSLVSCSSQVQNETPAELAAQALDEAIENLATPPEVSDEVSDVLLSVSGGEPKVEQDERFDISVNQVPARAFFLGLVRDTGFNIVVHPEVAGNITLELSDVSIEDVLVVCRDIYGYEYKLNNGIYTIFPRALRTEIFRINYLDVKRVGLSDTSVLVGKVESSSDNENGGNSSKGSQENGSLLGMLDENAGGKSGGAMSVPGARIQTLTKTDFWGSVKQAIIALIGGQENGRNVTVSPQAGLVIVKAFPTELQSVREFLERSSLSVKRQVLLEAKVVEVRLNDDFEAGINWNQITGQLAQLHNVSSVTNSVVSIDESVDDTFFSVLEVNNINELLSLLQTQGSVQVLSSPRVATVNNQKAVIRVGSDEFFVTGLSSDTTTGGGDTVVNSPDIELTSFFSGIALDVTPQISQDGEIILHIHPVITEVVDQVKELRIGDQLFNFPLALRDIRESDSVVKAQSGQVVVLGGLMQEIDSVTKGKRPGLGDVPLIGHALGRTKNSRKVKTELVILLKPTIVDDATTAEELLKSSNRIKAMGDIYRDRF